MYQTRDHETGDLFDSWAFMGDKRRRLLERSWAGVFREHLFDRLPIGQFAQRFSAAMGRPTKDLHVAMGVLILQQLHDLTDAATVEALAFNISWHYALDVRAQNDAYFCQKTLRNYRRLVIDRGLDELLFEQLTDELIRAFSVATNKQRLDSTAIHSAMRNLTRLGIVVETISKFVRELSHTYPQLHQRVDASIIQRYVEREGDGCFADTSPSQSKRRLPEAGVDLLNLSLAFAQTPAAGLESFAILQRVLAEQFETMPPTEPQGPKHVRIKEPMEIPCDNVRNPADPDSSYNKHRGQGYMVQVMETYQEDDDDSEPDVAHKPDLITHVAIGKMTEYDGHHLKPALDDVQKRVVGPELLLADSHYGSTDNIALALEQNVTLISPAMTAKGEHQDHLTLEQFEIDEQGLVTRCPSGHAPLSVSAGETKLQACFDPTICAACVHRDRCPTRTVRSRGRKRKMSYTYERVLGRKRRRADESDAFKNRYRWRAGMEATMSRLKHQMHLAHLRVRRRPAIAYVVRLRALGLNICRCTASMAA